MKRSNKLAIELLIALTIGTAALFASYFLVRTKALGITLNFPIGYLLMVVFFTYGFVRSFSLTANVNSKSRRLILGGISGIFFLALQFFVYVAIGLNTIGS